MDEAQWLKAATDTSTPICELSVQLSLCKAGMRLERRAGLSFQLPFYRTT